MQRLLSLIWRLVLSPFFLVVMLVGAFLERSELANWAAQRLGLQAIPGRKGSSTTGKEGFLGSVGEIRTSFEALNPDGCDRIKVFIRGELWNGVLRRGSPKPEVGQKVRVCEVDGLTLIVEPTIDN